jgi:hypothetical protein
MKKFFYGMIALLGVSLFLVGCETEVEVDKPYRVDNILVPEIMAADITQLTGYLAPTSGYTVVGVSATTVTLTAGLEVPAGKTLLVRSGTLATASGFELTVKGKVFVEYGTTLKSDTASIVVDGGGIVVQIGGTLDVSAGSVDDTAGDPAFNTVTFAGGTLKPGTVADLDELKGLFAGIAKGTLEVTTLTSAASVMPSEVASIPGLSKDRVIKVTVSKQETDEDLFIPAGLNLTTATTLEDITGLTVNGTLTANSATLAAATAITINGSFTTTSTGLAPAAEAEITVGAGGTLTATGATNTLANVKKLTVGNKADVDLGGVAATLVGLEELKIGDDSDVVLGTGTTVTFKTSTGLSVFTIGKSSLTVGEAAGGALVAADVTIAQDATIKGITLAVDKTITVQAATLTVAATGITLKEDGATPAKIVLKGGTTPGKLITGGSTTTLGDSGDITLTDSVEFVATDGTELEAAGAAAVTTAKGVTALSTTGAAFKSIQAGATGVDLTLKAGVSSASPKISATTKLKSES